MARLAHGRGLFRRGMTAALIVGVAATMLASCQLTRIASISVGDLHACAVLTDGTVTCWGTNVYGELGDGTTVGDIANGVDTHRRLAPVSVLGVTGATDVVVGNGFTCALLGSGSVQCWGHNFYGELGDTTFVDRLSPTTVSGITNATQITAGNGHVCVRLADATSRCWGLNANGELGDGTTTNRNAPVAPSGSLTGVVQIDAGASEAAISASNSHTCALLSDGTASCWGYNYNGQLGDGTTTERHQPTPVSGLSGATAISAGWGHTCALVAAGEAKCWGYNAYGQVGDGSLVQRLTPTLVSGLTGASALVTGVYHSCAQLAATVSCWGQNTTGELADGTKTNSALPRVSQLTGVAQLRAKVYNTCVVTSDGSARCAGDNDGSQVGNGDRLTWEPSLVGTADEVTNVEQVDAGGYSTCARLADGSVKCWGYNGNWVLGDGTANNRGLAVTVPGLTGVTDLAVGNKHACAVVGGPIKCWGTNFWGQLGNNTNTSSHVPVDVVGITDAIQVAVDDSSSCAVLVTGSVKCWGNNYYGEVGNGTSSNYYLTPVTVTGITTATQVTVARDHACARLTNSVAKCWGYNYYGQIGNGDTIDQLTPVVVPGMTTVVQVDAGREHTCAVLANNRAKCWGRNDSGQLGNNSLVDSLTPVTVSGLLTAAQITAGYRVTCATLTDGTAKCWGWNLSGGLGDGTAVDKSVPTSVKGVAGVGTLTGVTGVATAGDNSAHTCAVAGGVVRCWGYNGSGDLGDGMGITSYTPVIVRGRIG